METVCSRSSSSPSCETATCVEHVPIVHDYSRPITAAATLLPPPSLGAAVGFPTSHSHLSLTSLSPLSPSLPPSLFLPLSHSLSFPLSTEQKMSALGILNLPQQLTYNKGVFMHTVLNNNFPNYLAQLFISHQCDYTNSMNNLYVPRPRLDLFKTSVSFAGASLWNSLPQNKILYFSSLFQT